MKKHEWFIQYNALITERIWFSSPVTKEEALKGYLSGGFDEVVSEAVDHVEPIEVLDE